MTTNTPSSPENIPNEPSISTPKENVAVASPVVFVEPTPTMRGRIENAWDNSIQWLHKWTTTLRQPISIQIQYSPVRFTRGLTSVRLNFTGWGFCIYNGKGKHFHNSDLLLQIPINHQTPILIVGWGQFFKYSLFIDSSLKEVPKFEVSSDVTYASATLPDIQLNSPNMTIEVASPSIQIPPTPIFRVDMQRMDQLRIELSNPEDI